MIQGKATTEKIDELFSIFHLILTDAKLDMKTKVIEMLNEKKSNLESRIQGAGHSFANSRMKSRHRVGGYIDEILGGISYLDTVKDLLKLAEDDWPSLLTRLEPIRTKILDPSSCRDGMILDITGDDSVLSAIQPSTEKFLNSLPGNADGIKLCDFYTDIHPWLPEAKKANGGVGTCSR